MAAGDLVLAEIGRILSVHGHAGRLGGDEFAVLVPGNLEEAVQAAQRIMAQVSEVFEAGSGPKIDLSLGCAAAPTHGNELADLLEAADIALLDAKRAGPVAGDDRRRRAAPTTTWRLKGRPSVPPASTARARRRR